MPLVGRDGAFCHSGNYSDLVHDRTEFTVFEFNMLIASGRLPPCISIIWRKGALARSFGPTVDFHRNKLPHPPVPIIVRPRIHLDEAFSCCFRYLRVSHLCAVVFGFTLYGPGQVRVPPENAITRRQRVIPMDRIISGSDRMYSKPRCLASLTTSILQATG
jgi:hypothetical protein